MRSAYGTALMAGAMLLGTALPSLAATTTLTTDSTSATSSSGSNKTTVAAGPFDLVFTFVTGVSGYITGGFQASSSKASFTASTFTLTPAGGKPVSFTVDTNTSTRSGGNISGYSDMMLAAGSYTAEVKGNLMNAANSGAITSTFTVSQVPLPNSVAMLGIAIAGLGVAGAVRRKSRSAAATA